MHVLMLSAALFGQADLQVPPSPVPIAAAPAPAAAAPPAAPGSTAAAIPETAAGLRTWLLTRLIVDLSFDAQKSAEVERLLSTLNEEQLRGLVDVYREKAARRDQAAKAQNDASRQQAIEQAKLNLQNAEAYRDHLKREYDRSLLQGYMTQNLVYQNILNNQRMMYLTGNPYAYSTLGYGPYGSGALGYGNFGYGGYGYGSMYGGAYGPGMGFY